MIYSPSRVLLALGGLISTVCAVESTPNRVKETNTDEQYDSGSTGGFKLLWLLISITSLNYEASCQAANLCSDPSLQVSARGSAEGGREARILNEWDLVQLGYLASQGDPIDPLDSWTRWTTYGVESQRVSLRVSMVGIDPMFHFQRLCDETPAISYSLSELETKRTAVVLHGRCFNVTMEMEMESGPKSCRPVNARGEAHEIYARNDWVPALVVYLALITLLNTLALSILSVRMRYHRAHKETPHENDPPSDESYSWCSPVMVEAPSDFSISSSPIIPAEVVGRKTRSHPCSWVIESPDWS